MVYVWAHATDLREKNENASKIMRFGEKIEKLQSIQVSSIGRDPRYATISRISYT